MNSEDLTTKQLKFAYWWLVHKKKLLKLLVFILIIVNAALWVTAFYQSVVYWSSGRSYEEMLRGLTLNRINWLEIHKHFGPQELTVSDENVIQTIKILAATKELNYDFIAGVSNPNRDWMAREIDYLFKWSEGQTQIQKSFILPGEKKYFYVLGETLTSPPQNIRLEVIKIGWQRIRPEKRAPLEIVSKILVEDVKLTYIVPEERLVSLPELSFTLTNQSVYNFWSTDLTIIFYRDKKIVGVNKTLARNLMASEARPIKLILSSAPSATHIEVKPEINVFDKNIFMPSI